MQLTGNLGLKKPEGTDVVNIDDFNQNFDILDAEVTKLATASQAGRMSAADKVKLDGIESGAQRNTVTSVNNKTGAVTLTASDVGASPTGHTHAFADITSKPTTLSGYGITDAIPTSQKGAANGVASLDASTKVPTSQLPSASTSVAGIVQLNNTTNSTSTTQAATANAVKQVNDALAAHSAETATGAHKAKNIAVEDVNNHFNGTDVEAVLNELFTFANDGKTQIANAITAKGVSASPTETFASLAAKIGQISTGKKWASGTVTSSSSTGSFEYAGDTEKLNTYYATVTGLTFKPSLVFLLTTGGLYSFAIYSEIDDSFYPKTVKLARYLRNAQSSYFVYNLKGDISPASVTSTGFTLPVYDSNSTFTWIAFE